MWILAASITFFNSAEAFSTRFQCKQKKPPRGKPFP